MKNILENNFSDLNKKMFFEMVRKWKENLGWNGGQEWGRKWSEIGENKKARNGPKLGLYWVQNGP